MRTYRIMSTSASTTTATSRTGTDGVRWQSKIYQTIVTPINFVAFLLSLYLVDSHYRAQRHRQYKSNASKQDNNRRSWLHRLLYRQPSSPYDWVDEYEYQVRLSTSTFPREPRVRDEVTRPLKQVGDPWFYHTKQKKLFRVEAEHAFALRDSVLFGLCVLAILAGWVLWRIIVWLAIWVDFILRA
ncbi:hypothetical protein HD806DRAFT_481808 [Xylariaceae sp. AK1471]|nr:hypothetical protein HD806DRAFT_481808 [Xylariaceae sp. AK1471]